VLLLKANCLKWMRSPLQAEECLRTVTLEASRHHGSLSADASWVVPYSAFERATLLREQGDERGAAEMLESAK